MSLNAEPRRHHIWWRCRLSVWYKNNDDFCYRWPHNKEMLLFVFGDYVHNDVQLSMIWEILIRISHYLFVIGCFNVTSFVWYISLIWSITWDSMGQTWILINNKTFRSRPWIAQHVNSVYNKVHLYSSIVMNYVPVNVWNCSILRVEYIMDTQHTRSMSRKCSVMIEHRLSSMHRRLSQILVSEY